MTTRSHLVARVTTIGSLLLLLVSAPGTSVAAEPAPPYPPPPASSPPPARRPAPPPAYPTVAPPPPLSPVMRVIYAPFYAAGLVVRYAVYYVIVAPIEVFSRTINYGVEGGVEARKTPEGDEQGREGERP